MDRPPIALAVWRHNRRKPPLRILLYWVSFSLAVFPAVAASQNAAIHYVYDELGRLTAKGGEGKFYLAVIVLYLSAC